MFDGLFEIVVSGGLVTAGTVVLAFVVNRALVHFGVSLSIEAKKIVAMATAVGLTGFSAVQGGIPLPESNDPLVLGTYLLVAALSVFKAAQPVYDILWKALLEAE